MMRGLPIAPKSGNDRGVSVTVTMGKAGRIVLPKALREILGLREGSRLRMEAVNGKLEATPEPDAVRIELKDGFPVILGGAPRQRGDIARAIKAERDSSLHRPGDPEIVHP